MIDILVFLAVIFISYGIGKFFLDFFIKEPDGPVEDFVFSTGLGLGIIGYIVYTLGSFGLLLPGVIFTALLICASCTFYLSVRFIRRMKWGRILNFIAGLSYFEKFLLFVLIAVPSICFFGVSAPEIGNDALSYHLLHCKIFIQNHTIGHIPFTRESLWPYLTEMLFTLGLLLKSVVAAKGFHFFFGILSMLSVYGFTRHFFGKGEALLSAALFYSAPGIFMQSVYSYVDLALCFYSFAALYLIILWDEKDNVRYLVLSGIFTGLALSVKIFGGITLIALCLIILFAVLRKKEPPLIKLRLIFLFCLAVFFVSCVWYIRSYLVLKNPVFPFLDNIFKSGWDEKLAGSMGAGKDIISFLQLPWNLVTHIDLFGEEQIGVISLAFLPFLFFIIFKKNHCIKNLGIFLLSYTIIWFCIYQNIRFIFVNFAVIYILLSAGFYAASKRYNLAALKIILSICVLFNVSLCLYYNRDGIKLAMGFISREEYLDKNERSYPIAEFINKNLPPDSLILSIEPRLFYFDRKVISYGTWQETARQDYPAFINKLKESGPLYLLVPGEASSYGYKYEGLQHLIKNIPPIYKIPRKIDNAKIADYYIYKL